MEAKEVAEIPPRDLQQRPDLYLGKIKLFTTQNSSVMPMTSRRANWYRFLAQRRQYFISQTHVHKLQIFHLHGKRSE